MGFALFSTPQLAIAAEDTSQEMVFDTECLLHTETAKKNLFVKRGIVVDSSAYDQIKRMRTGGDYARTSYVSLSPSNHPPPPVLGTAHVYDSSFPTSYLGTTLNFILCSAFPTSCLGTTQENGSASPLSI
ncbi:uncharacterized protein LOC116192070 isoform X2 [Punica granatum]|uniref:Uncharacterized protein LOC116192070 isoform X2 n=1 Tax=Punica granatum TaxID=22663 RepID=A0A6P8C1B8_PUNGR|nr:uncharacterized protein LOC116192070 isoform X2 [Punica granatum]XP_031376350.1 uncharacterized protein LOC116192070 isoform X2 [Punica granatum]XP_031376351.1 uncharacterized protein LOC116192070 isoform X2 [Punica granatum]